MAWLTHPDINEIAQTPGYLFWAPTNLSAEGTWGTKLGFTEKGVDFDPGYNYGILSGEEKGEEPLHKINLGQTPTITATLKNYNATALDKLFPGLQAGGAVKSPGTILPGTDLLSATYTGYLLFVPDDTTNHFCILLQRASPSFIATAKIRHSHSVPGAFPIVFTGARKTNDADGIYYYGLLSGAVLR